MWVAAFGGERLLLPVAVARSGSRPPVEIAAKSGHSLVFSPYREDEECEREADT